MDKIIEAMKKPLPQQAFKKHPAKSYLTTISPDYTRERLTEVFGLFGVGWGLRWKPENTIRYETETTKGKPRYHYALLQADFWFMVDGQEVSFQVTGYSENDNLGDAMEGSRTNAVGAGAKQLLFQLHVYKNQPAPPTSQTDNGTSATPPPAKPSGTVAGDPMTAYWLAVKNSDDVSQEEGRRILESCNGDPVAALEQVR